MYFKISKIAISVMLCTAIAVSSCVSFGAKSIENEDKSIIFYDETITLDNNEVYVCADNIDNDYIWYMGFKNIENDEAFFIKGADCIDNPQVIKTTPGAKYFGKINDTKSVYDDETYDFNNTGGEYRKVRVKLSRYDYYFNKDSSYTFDGIHFIHDCRFAGTEMIGDTQMWSCLMIESGGVINFVAPDENGYVEIYVSTNLKFNTIFYTDYAYKGRYYEGHGGGCNGIVMGGLRKGVVYGGDQVSIYITDATLIQRYMAKKEIFNAIQMYRADVNLNGVVDIMDATAIQKYLARK